VTELIVLGVLVVLALVPATLARRRGRSFGWWWLAGLFALLPTTIFVLVAPRPGESHRFSAPRVLLLFGGVLVGFFMLVAVASQLF
jgi:hypothetical protein